MVNDICLTQLQLQNCFIDKTIKTVNLCQYRMKVIDSDGDSDNSSDRGTVNAAIRDYTGIDILDGLGLTGRNIEEEHTKEINSYMNNENHDTNGGITEQIQVEVHDSRVNGGAGSSAENGVRNRCHSPQKDRIFTKL